MILRSRKIYNMDDKNKDSTSEQPKNNESEDLNDKTTSELEKDKTQDIVDNTEIS